MSKIGNWLWNVTGDLIGKMHSILRLHRWLFQWQGYCKNCGTYFTHQPIWSWDNEPMCSEKCLHEYGLSS